MGSVQIFINEKSERHPIVVGAVVTIGHGHVAFIFWLGFPAIWKYIYAQFHGEFIASKQESFFL